MKFNYRAFLLVIMSAGSASAYGGTVHPLITDQAMIFLSNNKAYAKGFLSTPINGTTFRDVIRNGSTEPDEYELTDEQVTANSDLKTYNFQAYLNKDIDNAVMTLFTGNNPFVAVAVNTPLGSVFQVPTIKSVVDAGVKAAISRAPNPSLSKLKRATQHTYVKGEGMFGDTFSDISIAPYAAQAEYNMAVKAWKANDRAEAIRRLGRVLHYVQDITVPHHISLDINIPDVSRAAVEFVRNGPDGIVANSSQVRYETDAAYAYMTGTFSQSLLQGSVAQLQNNSAKGRSIPDVLMGIRSQIQASGKMGMVDGYSDGGLAKRRIFQWAIDLWDQITRKVTQLTDSVKAELNNLKEALVQGVRSTAAAKLEQVLEQHLNSTYKYSTVNDDFAGTAAALVPVAIVESAKILDRFAYDIGYYTLGSTIQAEAYTSQSGTVLEPNGAAVGYFQGGDYVCYENVNMTGVSHLGIMSASAVAGGVYTIRLDSPFGTAISQPITVRPTGGWDVYSVQPVPLMASSGIHTLCIKGESGPNGICNLDWIELRSTPYTECETVTGSVSGTAPQQLGTPSYTTDGIGTTYYGGWASTNLANSSATATTTVKYAFRQATAVGSISLAAYVNGGANSIGGGGGRVSVTIERAGLSPVTVYDVNAQGDHKPTLQGPWSNVLSITVMARGSGGGATGGGGSSRIYETTVGRPSGDRFVVCN